jgi:hypothetical protein
MFCKWCEMAGFKHNNRGKPAVRTDAGWGCQRAKLESVKDHEGTSTHKEVANLQMNQSNMKEAVKTVILQHDHIAHKFESGWEVGVIKAFDKKGPHAGKFSVKYKDDPNWWTHSLLREGYGKDKHWVLLRLPSRDSA